MRSWASWIVLSGLAMLSAGGVAAEGPPVLTYVRLLVGKPEAPPSGASVQVLPGTVVVPQQAGDPRVADLWRVIDELKETYRLSQLEPTGSDLLPLSPGQDGPAPGVEGGLQARLALLSADAQQASYRVTLSEGGRVLAEPVVTARRGGRAIVGSRDGAAAPYLFLVVEPLAPNPTRSGAASEPRLVKKVVPTYPPAAKQARLDGIVILTCRLGRDGVPLDIRVARGETPELTVAAREAVAQWRYEPARDAAGQPVEIDYTVWVRFQLAN